MWPPGVWDAAEHGRPLGAAPTSAQHIEQRTDHVRLLTAVDGYGAGNVFSHTAIERWPQGVAVPEFFVDWVHTSPRWRRAGLSRALFQRAMDDRWARAAAACRLWTGATNTAHTLYKSAGFIDLSEAEHWSRSLDRPVPAPRVKGLRLRPAGDADAARLSHLYNEVYRDYLMVERHRAAPLPEGAVAVAAERKGALAGFMIASFPDPDKKGKVNAVLREICVRPADDAEAVTRALVARIAAGAARRGAATIGTFNPPEDEAVRRGLAAAGFASRKTGGVVMWRLANLPLLLTRIVPLLEHRLSEGKRDDWCGTIGLHGERHEAGLTIENGKVKVLDALPPAPEVALHGRDDAISRLVVGRQTAFQAMLQLELRITPKANEDVTRLLEVLFPRVPLY